jgi:RimJ/RimL family protein N-acetyltransferase
MAIPVLTTERLALRGFRESDLDTVAAMESDPEVVRFLGTGAEAGRPRSRAESWTTMALMMGQWALKGYGSFAVEHGGTGAVIGRAGLLHLAGWPEPELAFAFARPAWARASPWRRAAPSCPGPSPPRGRNGSSPVSGPRTTARCGCSPASARCARA